MPIGPLGVIMDNGDLVVNGQDTVLFTRDGNPPQKGAPLPPGVVPAYLSGYVPVFCDLCFGTTQDEYNSFLARGGFSGLDNMYVVGTACVFGEVEIPSGATHVYDKYKLPTKAALSTVQRSPGTCLFGHAEGRDIGEIKCYWHVHSKSTRNVYLYTCAALNSSVYTGTILKNMGSISKALSLGTRGDHAGGDGILIDECSLVSVPMRQGCFATLVESKDVENKMRDFGFAVSKNERLTAGLDVEHSSNSETKEELLAELEACHRLIDAANAQLSILQKAIKDPSDAVAEYNLKGAQDFESKTGTLTTLSVSTSPEPESRPIPTRPDTVRLTAGMMQTQQPQEQQQQQTHVSPPGVVGHQPQYIVMEQPSTAAVMRSQPSTPMYQSQAQWGVIPAQQPQCPQFSGPMFYGQQYQPQSYQPAGYMPQFQQMYHPQFQAPASMYPPGVVPQVAAGVQSAELTEAQQKEIYEKYSGKLQEKQKKIQSMIEEGIKQAIGGDTKLGGIIKSVGQSHEEISPVIRREAASKPYSRVQESSSRSSSAPEETETDIAQTKKELLDMLAQFKSLKDDISKIVSAPAPTQAAEPAETEVPKQAEPEQKQQTQSTTLKAGLSVQKSSSPATPPKKDSSILDLFSSLD